MHIFVKLNIKMNFLIFDRLISYYVGNVILHNRVLQVILNQLHLMRKISLLKQLIRLRLNK